MKIVLPGGSGQVGSVLARAFQRDGHEVVVLSRRTGPAAPVGDRPAQRPARVLGWDGKTMGAWAAELEGAGAVINLAGRSVNCRYTAANKRAIIQSRIDSTRAIGEAVAAVRRPPRVWLQSSTATIYAHRYDAPNDEATGIIGGAEPDVPDTWRFSIDVATSWERAADERSISQTRLVKMRSAIVLSHDRGGIFDTLLGLVRRGLGGTSGDGRQYVSWIHEEDFVRSVCWLLDHDEIAGAVNLAAPNPLPNAEFMRILRRASRMPIGLPATRLMLEVGAFFMRTETELVLKSRRVVPGRLLRDGFSFRFPHWPEAAADLCRRWGVQ